MKTVAQVLVEWLESQGVEVVFGIPGVHTIELYRALAQSRIRHVTARHEAGAGFMADGYARVSGRFGVALVITGPGLTNILTPMAQARADSVPMLVISGVNARPTLGRGLGYLHEVPDQQALTATLGPALHLARAEDLTGHLAIAHRALTTGRGGPVHLEIPLDLMAAPVPAPLAQTSPAVENDTGIGTEGIDLARTILTTATHPVILAGGGCRRAGAGLARFAEALDAPVILTTNARGLMHGHPLAVPASPSLEPVRALIRAADPLIVLGSELGPTDCDMYGDGGFPYKTNIIRIDIDASQLARHPAALALTGDVASLLPRLSPPPRPASAGAAQAAATRKAAHDALSPAYRADVALLSAIRDACPGAIMVGDSTQIVYAGNLWHNHDRPGGWFNAATGYGALGYATGAAAGAALAAPEARVLCLIGDGGLMFAPGEVLTAVQESLDVTFLVFDNRGFGEIASAMREAGAPVLGCTPAPPDLEYFAKACGLPFTRCKPEGLARLLPGPPGPRMIAIALPPVAA